jgi:hypothetical protein
MRGRAFALLFVGIFIIQAGAVLAFNFVVNPRSEFPLDLFEPLTQSERARKLRTVADMPEGPDAIILGSSRAWGLPAEELIKQGYERPYNLALGAATATEALDAYRYLRAHQPAPRLVVMAFEDWQLYDVHRQPLDVHLASSPGDIAAYAPELARSLSYAYVRDSVTALKYDREGFPAREWALDADGDVAWERAEAAMARGESPFGDILTKDLGYASAFYYPGVERSQARESDFTTFVDLVAADDARLVLVLTPMHPDALARLPSDPYAASLAHARTLAMDACRAGAQVHDFTDPATYGSDLSGFVDGWHYTRAEGAKMLSYALTTPGSCQEGI